MRIAGDAGATGDSQGTNDYSGGIHGGGESGDTTRTGAAVDHEVAITLAATQNDSEQIAMQVAAALLSADGFSVADIHTEGRGYDLHATRGAEMRMVEVKGVWTEIAGHRIDYASLTQPDGDGEDRDINQEGREG